MLTHKGHGCCSKEGFLPYQTYYASLTESEKDGEPRNHVPEEGFKSEEGWHEMFHISVTIFQNLVFMV